MPASPSSAAHSAAAARARGSGSWSARFTQASTCSRGATLAKARSAWGCTRSCSVVSSAAATSAGHCAPRPASPRAAGDASRSSSSTAASGATASFARDLPSARAAISVSSKSPDAASRASGATSAGSDNRCNASPRHRPALAGERGDGRRLSTQQHPSAVEAEPQQRAQRRLGEIAPLGRLGHLGGQRRVVTHRRRPERAPLQIEVVLGERGDEKIFQRRAADRAPAAARAPRRPTAAAPARPARRAPSRDEGPRASGTAPRSRRRGSFARAGERRSARSGRRETRAASAAAAAGRAGRAPRAR